MADGAMVETRDHRPGEDVIVRDLLARLFRQLGCGRVYAAYSVTVDAMVMSVEGLYGVEVVVPPIPLDMRVTRDDLALRIWLLDHVVLPVLCPNGY